jgi:hypothetical protein
MPAAARPRPLTRAERAVAYALLGWSTEVVFTALEALSRRQTRDARLRGHRYLWMAPIYGLCAVMYEPAQSWAD